MENGTIVLQTSSLFSHPELMNAGIIGTMDMTIETALTKLYFLLTNVNRGMISQLIQTNMRGEISS